MMKFLSKRTVLRLIILFILLVCTGCFLYGKPGLEEASVPEELPQATLSLLPTATIERNDDRSDPEYQSTLNEDRWLTLEWPQKMREGDTDIVHLILDVDSEGFITPTVSANGHTQASEPVKIPDLYDTHDLVVEARLDMAGIEIMPYNEIREPLIKGRPLFFNWRIRPGEAGIYRGTLWLYLNLNPKDGRSSERITLIAKRLEVECVTFLGLSGRWARILGFGGSLVSFFLGLPFIEKFFYWIYTWFLSKGRQGND
jgi:hypothetical protein